MSKRLKCWLGIHKLLYLPYKEPVPPFTLPMHICLECNKVVYKLKGQE